MAVTNLTTQEKIDLAEEYDEQKRRFEKQLSALLVTFFNNYSDDFMIEYATQGATGDAQRYKDELAVILFRHYKKVGAFFSSHLQRTLRSTEYEDEKDQEVVAALQEERSKIELTITALLSKTYKRMSILHSTYILNTTNKVTSEVVMDAVLDLSRDNTIASNEEVAILAGKQLRRKNKSRIGTISETETQDAAGEAKQTEATELSRSARRNPLLGTLFLDFKKTWVSMGDNRVRNAHRIANGQEVGINDAFRVGGELLRYPADTSLGASLWNTIRCRCLSLEEI